MRKFFTIVFSLAVLAFSIFADDVKEPSGDIYTYFQGGYIDADTAISKLEYAGFEVLANYKSIKKGNTILFTCPTLKSQGAKPGRGHVAVMRLFIDKKTQTISVTNPVYFGKAYMQDEYNHALFSKVADKINTAFPGLKNSPDRMKYDELETFHFAMGMPYYEDQEVVGEGIHSYLLAKAREYKNGKYLVFELKLSETSTLFGYALSHGTTRFPKKLGRQNAGLLPWTVSVEDEEARILRGEYYIPLNYPLFEIDELMDIRKITKSVIKDLKKPFK